MPRRNVQPPLGDPSSTPTPPKPCPYPDHSECRAENSILMRRATQLREYIAKAQATLDSLNAQIRSSELSHTPEQFIGFRKVCLAGRAQNLSRRDAQLVIDLVSTLGRDIFIVHDRPSDPYEVWERIKV